MPIPDRPPFGVSHSRINKLFECPRSVGWDLFSFTGWLESADHRRRLAYWLKNLTPSIDAALGNFSHEEAERFARAALKGEELPSEEEVVDRLHEKLHSALESRDFDAHIASPKKSLMLRETWYYGGPHEADIARVTEKIPRIARTMCGLEVWEEIASMARYNVYLEDFIRFRWGKHEAEVTVKFDFIAHEPIWENVTLIDWKTGSVDLLVHQLALFALAAREALGAEDPEFWRARGIHLVTGEEICVPITEAVLRQAGHRLDNAIEKMRRYQDPETHVTALLPYFEPMGKPMRHLCSDCCYEQLCHDGFGPIP
jgi:hypothetical protein